MTGTIPSRLLIHRVDVRRVTHTAPGNGKFPEDKPIHLAQEPCRISSARMSDRVGFDHKQGQELSVITNVGYFNPGRDLQVDDEFVHNGRTLRVLGVAPPSEAHHLKVVLEEVQRGSS